MKAQKILLSTFVAAAASTFTVTASADDLTVNGSDQTITTSASYGNITVNNATLTIGGDSSSGVVVTATGAVRGTSEGANATTINISSGATLTSTGTTQSTSNVLSSGGSFMLSHWNATGTVNVTGTLNLSAGLSNIDGTGILNINSGGVANLNGGLSAINKWGSTTVNLNSGGRMNIGSAGIAVGSGTPGGAEEDTLYTLNLNGGTIGILGSDSSASWSSSRELTLGSSATTIDTTVYKMADDGNSSAKLTSDANADVGGKITLTGTLSGLTGSNLVLSGAGTVDVSGATFALTGETLESSHQLFTTESSSTPTVTTDGLTASNFTWNGEALSGRTQVTISTSDNVTSVTFANTTAAILVWGSSTSGTWDTSTTNKPWKNGDNDDSFYSGDNVTFSTSGANITVASGVSAGTVTISDNTTLTGSSFSAESVTISGGTNSISSGFTTETFAVSGGTTTLTSTNSSYVSATSTTIASGAKLILGTQTNSTGLLRGSATVNGTLEFTAKDVTGYSGGSTSLSSITVNSGGTVNLATSSGDNETFTGTLTLAGGSLTGTSGTIWDIFGSNSTINVTGSGSTIGVDLRIRRDNAEITISDGASLTVSGKIYVPGSSAGMGGSDTLKVNASGSGSFTFTGSSGSLGSGIHLGSGSLTVGDGTNASVLSVSRIEIGDTNTSSASSKLDVKSGATLKITGSTNDWSGTGSYKSNSVVFGEWTDQTTATIAGTLLAQNAEVGLGDVGGSITVSGTLAAKGIGQGVSERASSGKFDLTLSDGGKIILGESGIASVKTSGSATFNGGTVGLFSDTTTIAKNVTLASSTGTTFDTAKYSFNSDGNGVTQGTDGGTMTVSGVLSGSGKLVKKGEGTLVLSAANTFTGGVDISAGTLEVTNTSGLGTGSVSLSSGGTLKISVQNVSATSITFNDGAKFSISDSLISSTDADSIVLNLLASNTITFGSTTLTSDNANTLVDNYFDTSSLGDTYKDYLRTWGYDSNTLSLTLTIPEPSAFGLLAGTFALALAVSRRRRQKR